MAETRDAVAALRGESEPLPAVLARLIDDYSAQNEAAAQLVVFGERASLRRRRHSRAAASRRRRYERAQARARRRRSRHTRLRAGSTLLTIRNTNSANAEVARYPASGWESKGCACARSSCTGP